jgi:hypothetical protein
MSTDLELPLEPVDQGTHNQELPLEPELAIEDAPEPELSIEPDSPSSGSQAESEIAMAPLPVAQILPADFQLPALVKFVPDPRLRETLDAAVAKGLAIEVKEEAGLALADEALTTIRESVKAIEAHFEEPASIAHQLHKGITRVRGEWTTPGAEAIKLIGTRVFNETRRLDQIAADEARQRQEEEDARARAEAQREADAARASDAPASVVQELQERAKTATAPPVSTFRSAASAGPLKGNTSVSAWKARIKGTPPTDEPNPSMDQLSPTQKAQVLELMKAVVAGQQPLTCFDLNWSVLNGRAKAEKGTLDIVGIEAFESGSVRAKGGRK